MKPIEPISDAELRIMRNAVYPAQVPNQVQTDASWEQVKPKWRADVEWLSAEFNKIERKRCEFLNGKKTP